MDRNSSSKSYSLGVVVIMVCLLLLSNTYLTYLNSQVIEKNKNTQEEAEHIKLNTVNVIRNINSLDQSLRGYALVGLKEFNQSMDRTIIHSDSIFNRLERALKAQQYPMGKFQILKDSVTNYIALISYMRKLLDGNRREEFLQILSKDRGYQTWLTYVNFSDDITAFENKIAGQAHNNYLRALRNSYLLQIMLFFLIVPSLAYTAYYASKTLMLSERLRQSEEERNLILARQNQQLEFMVRARTNEILAQNEEISSQNEEITSHNEQLVIQQTKIEEQNRIIQLKNDELETNVEQQTYDLKQTNLELIEQNNRLEQFAYIISHNLRAPMARLVGLSTILDLAKSQEERDNIVKLIVKSTHDLDNVIKDLSYILGIAKLNTKVMIDVDLDSLITKIKGMLEIEIKDTHAVITTDFTDAPHIVSLPQYLESIFYNLLSNAIKYRHPDKNPVIKITSAIVEGFVKITLADNGLGIDMSKYRENLFNLYKRFHFHVEGKGMGLYLVKTQVSALGGKIEVESSLEHGTTFSVYLRNGSLPPLALKEGESSLLAE